ncbi:MAG: hypothetical protein H8D24_02715 [Gammaproteobacteria bacterium]|uniref:Uncharacterized protein n=1 Tax=Candidatus Thiopontia autotrophica TaxID=2841688 RepID=A0A8J6TS68_9GAMM|nr:hypothetical protein [Candidatus Thiopontia autotrophica]
MTGYIISILALIALLVGWVLFQEWLKKRDPQQFGYKPGCDACASKDNCSAQKPDNTIKFTTPK